MRILVTGAAGFVGSHASVALASAGHEVWGVDTFVNSKPSSVRRLSEVVGRSVEVVNSDVRDRESLIAVLEHRPVDCVVHCAGLKSVKESVAKPLKYYDTNVCGTVALLEAMGAVGVTKLVFSSSATVYGASSTSPVNERAPTGPTNPYGWSKLLVEQILADATAASPEMSVAALRYFNPIGAHESGLMGEDPLGEPANLLPYVARVAGRLYPRVFVRGADYPTPDGTGVRDYIHVMDLADGHVAAVEALQQRQGYHVWNLGTGQGTSVFEVISAMGRAVGDPIPYEIVERRAGDVAISYADVAKATAELGWKATRTVDDACHDLWRWQSKNPTGFPD